MITYVWIPCIIILTIMFLLPNSTWVVGFILLLYGLLFLIPNSAEKQKEEERKKQQLRE